MNEISFTLREFCKFNPPVFSGKTDPLIAEDWLEQITQILDSMPVEDEIVRIRLATFQLKDLTKLWWKSQKNT